MKIKKQPSTPVTPKQRLYCNWLRLFPRQICASMADWNGKSAFFFKPIGFAPYIQCIGIFCCKLRFISQSTLIRFI